ncbi:hypothetical protein [Streptomyces roseifaciens]|uniref:hypothetical protein n=1 Tax=Streptomyces roseifaciens TaxID=1488406 RepID=UPI000717FDD7|nr:hypothetical protein [Streptomyces roseifaciens]
MDLASVVLSRLGLEERRQLPERAEHVREVLYGYRSGSRELAGEGEPRPGYDPALPKMVRYRTKADELGISVRTIGRRVAGLESGGEAALATTASARSVLPCRCGSVRR